ncbi:hypothetical protein BaRGS_00038123 [Batillaria attramentaria]|uniref:SOCS box domain-containing protein n=1 Tax=Batillaria attramentaria TaxID=370345 RepID=A0ABD0J6R8_9CAEN
MHLLLVASSSNTVTDHIHSHEHTGSRVSLIIIATSGEIQQCLAQLHQALVDCSSVWCHVELKDLSGSVKDQLASGIIADVTAGNCQQIQHQLTMSPPLSQKEAEEGLFAACAVLCDSCAETMLQAGASTEARDSEHYTPLMQAARRGAIRVLRLLLEWDCQVNNPGGPLSNTALHLAATEGYLDCCQALVASGANVNAQNSQDDTALILASMHGHLPIVRHLLLHHASIRKRGYHEPQHGALQCCKVLLEAGAEIDAQDIRRFTPLMMSALNGHVDVVKLLIEWKCNVSMAAYNRRTALHLAAERGKQECCELLLDAGAAIDAQDGLGATPLHVMQFLISSGADMERRPNNGNSLMHLAAAGGSEQCCKELWAHGLNINEQNSDGNTPLFCAVHAKQVKTANFLLKAGCRVDERGLHGMTALNEAAFIGHVPLLKTLLRHGADPGLADDVGTLPLWFGVDSWSQENVRLLLEAHSPFRTRSTLNPQCGPCDPLEHAAHRQRDMFVSWMLAVYGEEAANCLRLCLPSLERTQGVKSSSLLEWQEKVVHPQSLLVECRRTIRRSLTKDAVLSAPHSLKDLSLPQTLKNFLCLQDLPDCKSADVASS